MRLLWTAGLVSIAMTGTSFADVVQPGKEGVLANLVAPVPGERICFARNYSRDHLEAHPKQRVTGMQFQLTYYRHAADQDYPKGQRNYYFRLIAKLRDKTKPYSVIGECNASGANIRCGVECDGGGVNIRKRQEGKLLVYFGDYDEIRLAEGCGEEEDPDKTTDLKAGADDKEFLLNPVAAENCPAYEKW